MPLDMRKFLFLLTIYLTVFSLSNCLGEEAIDKVAITKIEFFQKGKIVEVFRDDAPMLVRVYLEAKDIKAELSDKFFLIFYLDGLPLRTFPIADVKYTPFVDYLWEKPTNGSHSIGASLSTKTGAGRRLDYKIFIEEARPVLRVGSLEIDTTRRLKEGDRIKLFLFVSNDSEKVIPENDFIAQLQLTSKEGRSVSLDFGESPRIGPKAHNVSLGPIEWVVEDGHWVVSPQIFPRVVGSRKVLEVVGAEEVFLDLRIGESRPDLFLKFELSPPSPYMGEKVTILVNVENGGDLACEKYRLFLFVDGKRKGSITDGPTILPGKSKDFQFEWTVEGGTHHLKVSAYYIFDEREFLAKYELPLSVKMGIDLAPAILSWKPIDAQDGDIMTILTKIENIGVNPIIPWDEEREIGCKAVFSVDGIEKGVRFDGEMGAGRKADFEFSWEAEEGEHLLKFSVFYVVTKDMEPLSWSDEKTIRVLSSPKLVCVQDSWVPNPSTEGDSVVVSLGVRNEGEGMARLWDEENMLGYKLVFSIGSEVMEDSKPIAPRREVTFSFDWKAVTKGEYPVRVAFVHPGGKEVVRPYTGTISVLSPEPIDKLGKETLKFLESKVDKRVSLYKSLAKSLDDFLHPPRSQSDKVAKKTCKIALATVKSLFEERDGLPFSEQIIGEKELLEINGNLEGIIEDIERSDWSGVSEGVDKLQPEYTSLRNHIARYLLEEGELLSLLEKEATRYRQMVSNNLAASEGRNRPYPDAKNELLQILNEEDVLVMNIYRYFQKAEPPFAFLKKEAEREKMVKIQLAILKSVVEMLKCDGVRAQNLQKVLFDRKPL